MQISEAINSRLFLISLSRIAQWPRTAPASAGRFKQQNGRPLRVPLNQYTSCWYYERKQSNFGKVNVVVWSPSGDDCRHLHRPPVAQKVHSLYLLMWNEIHHIEMKLSTFATDRLDRCSSADERANRKWKLGS